MSHHVQLLLVSQLDQQGFLCSFWLGFFQHINHKGIVPCNNQPIKSNDDLFIFSLAGITYKPCCLNQNPFSWINEYFALILDSDSLQYNIIFGADILDKCGFHLDYGNNLVHWMEYDPSMIDLNFSLTITIPPYSHQLYCPQRWQLWECLCWIVCNMYPWCKIWTGQHPQCYLHSTTPLTWSGM